MRRGVLLAATVAASICALTAPAAAAPPCPLQPQARTLADLGSTLESIIAGPDGRLYFTDAGRDRLMVLDRPGAEPRVLVEGIESPGGLTFIDDGSLLVSSGNSIPGGLIGNIAPVAKLISVDIRSGQHETFAEGLAMGNGLATAPDGAVYASDDVGLGIDRIIESEVEHFWASGFSTNGLAVDRAGEYLYAAQTFQPAAILRVALADPSQVETWANAPVSDIASGPDGMTRDGIDRLYVAANSGGEIWRVNKRREICTLATSPPLGPSAVSFGQGRKGPFPRRNLYFVTFQGKLVELAGVLKGSRS